MFDVTYTSHEPFYHEMRDLPVFWPLSRKEPHMRAPLLLLRCCFIIMLLIHLVILSCLFLGICTGHAFLYMLTPMVCSSTLSSSLSAS
jgi:hypothetical protein